MADAMQHAERNLSPPIHSHTHDVVAVPSPTQDVANAEHHERVDDPATDRLDGTVTATQAAGLILQLSDGRVGFLSSAEFGTQAPQAKAGDVLQIWVMDWDTPSTEQQVQVSESKRASLEAFEHIRALVGSKTPVRGEVIADVKGGLSVEIGGLRAFLPANKISLTPATDLRAYVGKKIDVHVIDFDRQQGGFVLSRRVFAKQEAQAKRAARLHALAIGDVVSGTIQRLATYGAFVDLGDLTGLLHVKDMAWTRTHRPDEVVQPGQQVKVKILAIDHATGRVTVGLKQVAGDPWSTISERFKIGQKVRGKVMRLSNFGAFVAIEPGIEGLVHVSEMSWTQRISHPSEMVAQDAEIDVVILDIDPPQHRMALGLKQTQPSPWDLYAEQHPMGSTITGAVTKVTPQGVTLQLALGVTGFCKTSHLHAEEIGETERKHVAVGETVTAKIVQLDAYRHRINLSVRALASGDEDYRAYLKEHATETAALASPLAQALAPFKEKLRDQDS